MQQVFLKVFWQHFFEFIAKVEYLIGVSAVLDFFTSWRHINITLLMRDKRNTPVHLHTNARPFTTLSDMQIQLMNPSQTTFSFVLFPSFVCCCCFFRFTFHFDSCVVCVYVYIEQTYLLIVICSYLCASIYFCVYSLRLSNKYSCIQRFFIHSRAAEAYNLKCDCQQD